MVKFELDNNSNEAESSSARGAWPRTGQAGGPASPEAAAQLWACSHQDLGIQAATVAGEARYPEHRKNSAEPTTRQATPSKDGHKTKRRSTRSIYKQPIGRDSQHHWSAGNTNQSIYEFTVSRTAAINSRGAGADNETFTHWRWQAVPSPRKTLTTPRVAENTKLLRLSWENQTYIDMIMEALPTTAKTENRPNVYMQKKKPNRFIQWNTAEQ